MAYWLRGLVAAMVVSSVTGLSSGQGHLEQVECTGVVLDDEGHLVSEADVVCAEQRYDYGAGSITWGTPRRTTSDSSGRFRTQVRAERKDHVWVVAWKKGHSLGWQRMRNTGSAKNLTIRLSQPAILAGVVVDESGKAVPGATVRPCLKMDWMGGLLGVRFDEPREWFTVQTDAQGRFQFDNIPVAASADFWVEAPGWASSWTYWEKELSDSAGSQFKAGQTDVRIVLKPEAIVEGRVIDEDSGKGIAGVVVLARPNARYANYSCVDPVTSGPDGAFVYRGLTAGDYSLQIVAPHEHTAEWTGQDVRVTAVARQTVDVKIPVGKGGLIEVTVLDAATGRAIESAQAAVSQQANFGIHPCWWHSAYADPNGVVRLRAPAGECHLATWAEAYADFSDSEPAIVTEGQVLRRKVRLDAFPVVTGIVRNPDGQPAAGVLVASKPICEEPATTDEQGRFRVTWPPSESVENVLVLARDPDHNLAGLADVKDQSRPVEVTLAPAFAVGGRITDPNGKPIRQAVISLCASMPGWWTGAAPDVLSDANGFYEARAIPAPRDDFTYRLQVKAQGYGPTALTTLPFDSARDGRVTVGTISLPVADKSISGVVVDANGAPGAGLPIFITGPNGSYIAGQPQIQTVSDAQGRFSVEGVCAGPLQIQASFSSSPGGMGMLDAQGGDQNAKVILGRSGVHIEVTSLLGKPLPDTRPLLDLPAEQMQGKAVLLCFFDMNQRPSRYCLTALAKRAEELGQKGVMLIAVQAADTNRAALEQWFKEQNITVPVGSIQGDAKKVTSAWGVQSLPWLILTDKDHRVIAEGFTVDELSEKMKATELPAR
ncbi:MAG: carboxypeptidase regulatory-like domain-containing protein [Phycisphaerae bacterium]|nr:carboxypeptidase regulatory-like domain-containing protein [Phycisphaerae bacterium]